MTPLTEALLWNGIVPPPQGSNHTLCPYCSHTREKAWERCLQIRPTEEAVALTCFHCGYENEVPL